MKQLKTLASAAALSAAVVAAPAQAEQFWADNSITLLHSADYFNVASNFGAPNKEVEYTTVTLEHVSGHSWGDAFFFLDRHHGKGAASGFNETYSEISPRISLGKTTGADLSFGPIKDVLLAGTYEYSCWFFITALGTYRLTGQIAADDQITFLGIFNASDEVSIVSPETISDATANSPVAIASSQFTFSQSDWVNVRINTVNTSEGPTALWFDLDFILVEAAP